METMNHKTKHILFMMLMLAMIFPLSRLRAGNIGVAVNGTCDAGSCPAVPLPYNSTATLPFDISLTLADGDEYLIYGSMTEFNNSNGTVASNTYAFQVTYEGNASGGPSAADTINVERYNGAETSLAVASYYVSFIGGFSPGIAATSSASTCFDETLTCLGPANPPGSFDTDSYPGLLDSANGAFTFDKVFTSNFGAGSPVGSYIVWGQTAPLPPPSSVPEPGYTLTLGLGLGGIFLRKIRRSRGCSC
jgi:hypothetical protein